MANTCSKPAVTPITHTHTHANCPFHEYLIVNNIKSQALSNYGGVVVLEIGLRFETNFWRWRFFLEIDWIFTRCCLVLGRCCQDHSCRDMNVLNIFFRNSALNEGLYRKTRADRTGIIISMCLMESRGETCAGLRHDLVSV